MGCYWPECERRIYCDSCKNMIYFSYATRVSFNAGAIPIIKLNGKRAHRCLGCHLGIGYGMANTDFKVSNP